MDQTTSSMENISSSSMFNLDYKKLLLDLRTFWWLFVITIPLALSIVWVIHRYSIPVYMASMKILMEERGSDVSQTDMMEGFGLTPAMRNVDNQIALLTSRDMIAKAVNSLDFEVSYFVEGSFKTTEVYPPENYMIQYDKMHAQLVHTPIYIDCIDKKHYVVKCIGKGYNCYTYSTGLVSKGMGEQTYEQKFEVGEWVTTPWFKFKLICEKVNLTPVIGNSFIEFNDPGSLTSHYVQNLGVGKTSENSSIVSLAVNGVNPAKNIKFLTALSDVFISSNLDKKNKIATNTIKFIESQLVNISDSLTLTGAQLSTFRSVNRIQSVSSKSEYIFGKLQELEQKIASLYITKNYYKYLKDYFTNEKIDNDIIAPAIYQSDNQVLSAQIQKIMSLNMERLSISKPMGENINPVTKQYDTEMDLAKETLLRTIDSQTEILDQQIDRLKEEKQKQEKELNSLPETERKMMGMERKFQLNNEVYTYLLRKRSEAQIQKASNTPDPQVLETARSVAMVSPNKKGNYQKALMIGVILPLLFMVLKQLLNNKIVSVEDVEKITDFPVIGQIIHSSKEESNVVRYFPKSIVTESFRRLRTRLEFMTGNQKCPVITVSSSMPGEGKTYCSLNMASVFAVAGKKTILIGFDMRKPGLNKVLHMNEHEGLSNYLIGQVELEEVIIPCPNEVENLFVLPTGSIPPNPSELISSNKTKELLKRLRNEYDMIIIDSPPMGVVADPYLLARQSDSMVFLTRFNHTIRDVFLHTIQNLGAEGITSVGILINDLQTKHGRYGYRYGYGYGYGYGKGYYEDE